VVKRRFLVAAAGCALMWTGCRSVPVAPPPPPLPPRPTLERTSGEAVLRAGGVSITYKGLRIAVDLPPDDLTAAAPALDFLLVTATPRNWGAGVRRDLKIVAPADGAAAARSSGFINAKALASGSCLMLSKPGVFVFVSAVQARNPGLAALVNGYLLEFDNGRNVFISGDLADLIPVREFVYSLRDDGKQLQLAFINAGKAPAPGAALRRADEAMAAEMASLLGPRVAVIIDRGGLDRAGLATAFTNQIFDGSWYVAASPDSVPF